MGYFEHKTLVVTCEGHHFENAYKKQKNYLKYTTKEKKLIWYQI